MSKDGESLMQIGAIKFTGCEAVARKNGST